MTTTAHTKADDLQPLHTGRAASLCSDTLVRADADRKTATRTGADAPHWYAARVIDRRKETHERLSATGLRTYSVPGMPTLLFVQCAPDTVKSLRDRFYGALLFYLDPTRTAPAPISDREMASFIIVTSGASEVIELDMRDRSFFQGQKVRVTGGPFEGAEGIVKRIKGDRRLIVEIPGVTVVATSYIHPSLLEPAE